MVNRLHIRPKIMDNTPHTINLPVNNRLKEIGTVKIFFNVFREVYEHLAEKANLTSKKLQIVCPKQTDDLIAEGQALHHCVGTYIERVAAKKCLIVFVRRVEEPKKPYVTVEVRNGKIEQIHGDHNSDPTEEVKKFVDLWSRKVLPMALQAA